MHFKDFTDQFYQYPHQLSYSQLLRSHHASFESFEKSFENQLQHKQQIGSFSGERKTRFNGKTLKNIFTQLKNKASSELESFIDLTAINNAAESETPNTSVARGYVLSPKIIPNYGDIIPKETLNKTKNNDSQIRYCLNSEEFDHIERSIKFMVSGKKVESENYHKDENFTKPGSSSMTNTKDFLPEVQEGRIIEVYNVLKKVISNVKWKYKRCRSSPTTDEKSPKTNKKDSDSCDGSQDKCEEGRYCNKCGKSDMSKRAAAIHECNCWTTEEETLFCLLKLEARENFKQIKHIEQELKMHKTAIRALNKKCKSLEHIVMNNVNENNNLTIRNTEGVQEIFIKSQSLIENKQFKNSNNNMQIGSRRRPRSADAATYMNTNGQITIVIPNKTEDLSFSEIDHETPISVFNEENYSHTYETPTTSSKIKQSDNDLKYAFGESSKSRNIESSPSSKTNVKVKSDKRTQDNAKIDGDVISKTVPNSKVRITISTSKIVINTESEEHTVSEPTDLQKKETTHQIISKPSSSKNVPDDSDSCHCITIPTEEANICMCANKKSSFIIKLFRKNRCDEQCKCCTITTSKLDKKKCKYHLEKKKKKSKTKVTKK